MYVKLTDERIIDIKDKTKISLWDTIEKAESFYNNQEGIYTGMKIDNPIHAYSTPNQAFKLNRIIKNDKSRSAARPPRETIDELLELQKEEDDIQIAKIRDLIKQMKLMIGKHKGN